MDPSSVLVIGNFDGVHLGHQEVLHAARELEPGARLVAVTFWPHPMSVVHPGEAPKLLCPLEERVELLLAAGADEVKVIEFTEELMQLSPEVFVAEHLRVLNPVRIVVGENFRFGHRAQGTVQTLAELGRTPAAGEQPFEVTAVEMLNTKHQAISSTRIRALLAAGDVETAAEFLGRPFRFSGIVVMGHQRGREFGFPTANLPVPKGYAAPADGIYAGWLRRADTPQAEPMPVAVSVGTNPTFDDVPEVVVEAHVLDRDDLELYGVAITVDFIGRLRGNVKFVGVPELIEQIAADVADTRELLG